MMKAKIIYISATVLCALGIITACSTTPGDAAFRGGHYEHAAEMYRLGSEQGDSLAARKLGFMIQKGAISPNKYGNATTWFVRGCELGDVASCHNAALAYENGTDGVAIDYKRAGELYRKVAEKGYLPSQYNLGSLYANKFLENDVEGLKWMIIAENAAKVCNLQAFDISPKTCAFVRNDPANYRKKLRDRMSSQQIEQATHLATAWQAK